MITRRSWEGALKWALRDLRLEDATPEIHSQITAASPCGALTIGEFDHCAVCGWLYRLLLKERRRKCFGFLKKFRP